MPYETAASRRRKPTDFDRQRADAIASIVGYAVSFRKGAGETFRVETPDLALAVAVANQMNAEHGRYGRRATIYGLTPSGSAVPLSDTDLKG